MTRWPFATRRPSAPTTPGRVEGNELTREQQAGKLRPIVEVAEEVWG